MVLQYQFPHDFATWFDERLVYKVRQFVAKGIVHLKPRHILHFVRPTSSHRRWSQHGVIRIRSGPSGGDATMVLTRRKGRIIRIVIVGV
jgi:hypothetical protein